MSNPQKAETVTIADFDALLKQISDKEKEIEAQKAVLTKLNKELATFEGKGVAILKDLDRKSYTGPSGTFKIVEKWRVNLPGDDLAKQDFFAWLREKGIFDKYATVNSNSLNALFMAEWAEVKKTDPVAAVTFQLPGIEAAKLYEAPDFKPAKG